jgi:hypothetical protein
MLQAKQAQSIGELGAHRGRFGNGHRTGMGESRSRICEPFLHSAEAAFVLGDSSGTFS